MVEKGFNSWRGPMEGASGSAIGQVSKRVKAKELAPQGWRVGQDQHWEESGSDDEDSECPVDMAFACREWGATIGLCDYYWCLFEGGLEGVGRLVAWT